MKAILQRKKPSQIIARLLLAMIGLILLNGAGFASEPAPPLLPGPITTVANATPCSGHVFTVPVTVSNFNNIGNISLKLNFDPAMVEYQSAVANAALLPYTPVYGAVGGQFSFSLMGADPGINMADNSVLFTLSFLAKAGVSGTTFMSWSEVPGDCEYSPPGMGDPYVTIPFSNYFINGNCNIKASPVPALSGSQSACVNGSDIIYTTDEGKSNYVWTVSAGGAITAGGTPSSNTATVSWSVPGSESIAVNYTDANGCEAPAATSLAVTVTDPPVPTITGPLVNQIGDGATNGQVYSTEPGMTGYNWTVSAAGLIVAGQGTDSVTVNWLNPPGNQSVTVTYLNAGGCAPANPTSYVVLYYPFLPAIDPTIIPQFVDPLPHFAAGLRVNAKAGGNLLIKEVMVQQVALSTGTVCANGTIGPGSPGAGKGNYAAYAISTDNGANFGPAMWPAQTIEAQQGNQLVVQYRNDLFGIRYSDFNILADQTLMPNGYTLTGNKFTDPYTGDIPMVVHLHGGEMPSNSDGGPSAWFTPGYNEQGPGFAHEASSLCTYPNSQEGTTLWYHPHDQGLTRINVYTGLAGYYFLRGTNEDALHLPGWSGDDLVREITPVGKQPTFNGSTAYLPEIEIAIQDRMFNVNGELYWPVAPTNPDVNPFWTPEFFGDVMTVNGKSWPYLSVAPRKYLFRMLDGCNARFLNLWLTTDTALMPHDGPPMTVIATEGGFLETPVTIPASGSLFIAPAERPMVIIDFSSYPAGTIFYLVNDALAPFPTGDPVQVGLTDRIMQFVVNGELVPASGPGPGTDNSVIPANLRPTDPMVKLTDFSGNLNITPTVTRQLILNEISGAGGPLTVAINNSRFENLPPDGIVPAQFGGPTEIPVEGTTEVWQIINTSADAHPMHIHLTQWQLVSRQAFNVDAYMAAYSAAWVGSGIPNYPSDATYPGGSGSPYPYDSVNSDGAVGGNPSVSPFLLGSPVPPLPEERGWKDAIKANPGEVATYICRLAPTDVPLAAPPEQLVYPFDPSLGPGFVWHCHIIDHEDMDMMRPMPIAPSPVRFPQITAQPVNFTACVSDVATFTVTATSVNTITYQWQVSTDGGTVWTDLADGGPYSGVASGTLTVNTNLGLTGYKYRCDLTNIDGTTLSAVATLTVNACSITGTLKYFNTPRTPLTGMTVTVNTIPPVTSAPTQSDGSFSIPSVPSGTYNLTIDPNGKAVGGINSTDAGSDNWWGVNGGSIEQIKFNAGDVTNDVYINASDAQSIQQYFVYGTPFARSAWSFWPAGAVVQNNFNPSPMPTTYSVTVDHASVGNYNLFGMCTGDFNGSFVPISAKATESHIAFVYGSAMKVGPNESFDLAIRTTTDMEVGAVSLILNIPSELVIVEDVSVIGSNDPASYSVTGDELRIGWHSTTPVFSVAGGDLVLLKLRTTQSFVSDKMIRIELIADPLNELADKNMQQIPEAVLSLDVVESSPIGINENQESRLAFVTYPNPSSEFSTFSYSLPVAGHVSLVVRNLLGVMVDNLAEETQPAGRHEIKLDCRNLPDGVYTAMLRFNGTDQQMVSTIKFVVKK